MREHVSVDIMMYENVLMRRRAAPYRRSRRRIAKFLIRCVCVSRSQGGESGEDDIFDAIVGKLEEIVMGEQLQPLPHRPTSTICVLRT